jgi:hypothetical protein
MKKLITIALLATSSVVLANDDLFTLPYKEIPVSEVEFNKQTPSRSGSCDIESWKWDQGRSGTAKIKVTGVTNCSANTRIDANFYCGDKFLSSEWTFIRPGGGFRLWPEGHCNGALEIRYTISD